MDDDTPPLQISAPEKYLLKYAVSPLQPPEQSTCAPMAKPQGKQKCLKGNKVPNNQSTMEQFIGLGGPWGADTGIPTDIDNTDATAMSSLDPPQFYTSNIGQEPHGWT